MQRPEYAPILSPRLTVTKEGVATCGLCKYTWRLVHRKIERKCRNCAKVIFPKSYNPYKCHPLCWKGMCAYLALDFIVSRSSWRAYPTSKGIDWRTEEAVPTNSHDLMLQFKVNKWSAMMFWKTAISHKWLVRVREQVSPPKEINQFKLKDYFYNHDKKRRTPRKRSLRPTFIQHYPTSSAMDIFRRRFPNAFTRTVLDGKTVWNPVYIDKTKYLIDNSPKNVPYTKAEKQAMKDRLDGL